MSELIVLIYIYIKLFIYNLPGEGSLPFFLPPSPNSELQISMDTGCAILVFRGSLPKNVWSPKNA